MGVGGVGGVTLLSGSELCAQPVITAAHKSINTMIADLVFVLIFFTKAFLV
jgi:hypothetical protein